MECPPGAVWIGPAHPFDLHEAYVNFRRTLTIGDPHGKAVLRITADSRYRLWVNGECAARGPSRCWPHAQQVDEIDVSHMLRAGRNVIAVQIYSPGYSHFAYAHRGACGFIAWLDGDDGTPCVSDTAWRTERDPSWRSDVGRVSIYGTGIERRDMRRAADWWLPEFDDASWGSARIVAPAESPLWPRLVPRDVSLLVEDTTELTDPWFRRVASLPTADAPHEALREIMMGNAPVKTGQGLAHVWVFDLGVSAVCQAIAEIRGASGGERLLVGYAEKLRDGEVVISDPATYCRMQATDEFILRDGSQRIEGFSFRGGRYLIFTLCTPHGALPDVSFAVRRCRYPLNETPLRLADPVLQAIADLCRRTLLACLQDGFVDSVWRESSQWLGDGVAEAFALAAIADDHRPLRRLITMAAAGAYADGILPSVLPGDVHAYAVTDYNFSWIELLAMYRGPDRTELLRAMQPAARKMLARFARDVAPDGLIRSQPGRRLFLDWSPVDRREPNLTYNARYLHALQLAQDLGLVNVAADIAALRQSIMLSFKGENGWHENTSGTPASQLGLSLLILTGCAAQEAAETIVARSLDLDDGAAPGKLVLASPFMHHYVFLALDKLGQRDHIIAIIRARWGRWANAGEATCWENWNVEFPDGSTCHGFSAHPLGWLARLATMLTARTETGPVST